MERGPEKLMSQAVKNWAIETRKLTRHYGRQCVVNRLDLRIPTGCIYGLLGRNGAGKSTSIKMLMGLVEPDYGSAWMLGEEVSQLKPETRGENRLSGGRASAVSVDDRETMRGFLRPFLSELEQPDGGTSAGSFRIVSEEEGKTSFSRATGATLADLGGGSRSGFADPRRSDAGPRSDCADGISWISIVQIIQRPGRTILFSSHILPDVERVADRIGVMLDGVLRVDCPTELFKESVLKVVCEFAESVPSIPSIPGMLQQRQLGRKLELSFVRYSVEQRTELEKLHPKKIEEVSLGLEDAFIEYTRESRRPLNLFSGEELPEEVADAALAGG
jgi:ABC-2 type transport system ATP-binding protein